MVSQPDCFFRAKISTPRSSQQVQYAISIKGRLPVVMNFPAKFTKEQKIWTYTFIYNRGFQLGGRESFLGSLDSLHNTCY